MPDQAHIDRLLRLRDLVHDWNASDERTAAYADLMLAFALARLGAVESCRVLCRQAEEILSRQPPYSLGWPEPCRGTPRIPDPVHARLLSAFAYRIVQALACIPPRDPLPADLFAGLADRILAYLADRLREKSWLLEPHERASAYRWQAQQNAASPRDAAVAALACMVDASQLPKGIEEDLAAAACDPLADRPLWTAQVVAVGLNRALSLQEDFRIDFLHRAIDAWESLWQRTDGAAVCACTNLLERGLSLAALMGEVDAALPLAARLPHSLVTALSAPVPFSQVAVLESSLWSLRRLNLMTELRRALNSATDSACSGQGLSAAWSLCRENQGRLGFQALYLLVLAGGWLSLGEANEALAVIDGARELLAGGQVRGQERASIAWGCAAALGQAPPELGQDRLEALFQEAGNVGDTFTTNAYFSISRLAVVEAVLQPLLLPAATSPRPGDCPTDLAWLASSGHRVWSMARPIYDECRFADLPVLADAMEEAGCTNGTLLHNLRGPEPYPRGAWALDVLLGER
jgi:hypothetical protein